MFDYKEFLENTNFSDVDIEIHSSSQCVEIIGTKKELLYLASCLIEYVKEDCFDCDFAELNFDAGINISKGSPSLRFFLK